jgi:hypothetical protein
MNITEIFFFSAALLALWAYFQHLRFSGKTTALLVTACVIPLIISIYEATQFLTTDERVIIDEAIALTQTPFLTQWDQNLSKTTDLVFHPMAELLHFFFPSFSIVSQKMLWKAIHWAQGVALIGLLHFLIASLFSIKKSSIFAGLFFGIMLTLPSNVLALKVFNYDLLSMLFALISLFAMLLAHSKNSIPFSFLAIATATLGAQEKLTASPFLILAIISHGYLWAHQNTAKISIPRSLTGVFGALLCAMSIGFGGTLYIWAIRQGNIPAEFWLMSFDPIDSWIWVFSMFSFGSTTLGSRSHPTVLGLLCSIAILFLGAVFISYMGRFFRYNPTGKNFVSFASKAAELSNKLTFGIFLLIFCLGLYGVFFVQAYWHPFFPVLPGHYMPVGQFNDAKWHFGAPTFFSHLFRFVCFSCAVFIVATPSVLTGAAFYSLLQRKKSITNPLQTLLLNGLLIFSLTVPIVFGFVQIPVLQKYMNIGLCLFGIIIVIKLSIHLHRYSPATQLWASTILGVLLVLETWPFGSLYASFRPFWATFADPGIGVAGKINPSWVGWGEEIMIAGKRIRQITSDPITLYAAYTGDWLQQDPTISTVQFYNVTPAIDRNSFRYTNHDYYVINRSILVQQAAKFPSTVQPIDTISYRGFTQAWIFRGDHLKEAGFRF